MVTVILVTMVINLGWSTILSTQSTRITIAVGLLLKKSKFVENHEIFIKKCYFRAMKSVNKLENYVDYRQI